MFVCLFVSFLGPIRVHVLYVHIPAYLPFHQHLSPSGNLGRGKGKAKAQAQLMLWVLWICCLGGWWNGLMVVAERRGLSQPLGTGGEKGEMCFFLVMSD